MKWVLSAWCIYGGTTKRCDQWSLKRGTDYTAARDQLLHIKWLWSDKDGHIVVDIIRDMIHH